MHVAETIPYPWPWDGQLEPMRLAMLVVGAQEWLAGRTRSHRKALDAAALAAHEVKTAEGVVLLLRHVRPWAAAHPRVLPRRGEPGWQLAWPGATPDAVVEACGVSGFHGGSLDDVLRSLGRDRLVLAGLGLETAVYSTLTAANDRGYECLVLADAAAPHDPAIGERALASIGMSGGIFGAVGRTGELCAALRSMRCPRDAPP
jgi:biuret amidohydrolase